MELTDAQWEAVSPLLPEEQLCTTSPGRGRPWRDPRDVLNGILWVLRTGAPWKDIPSRYPPYQTCHRRFQQWVADGLLDRLLRALAEDLRKRGGIDLSEAFIDGTHAGAKKGARWLAEHAAARRPRSWQWQTALVFLSPSGSRAVSAAKSDSSKKRSTRASSRSSRDA